MIRRMRLRMCGEAQKTHIAASPHSTRTSTRETCTCALAPLLPRATFHRVRPTLYPTADKYGQQGIPESREAVNSDQHDEAAGAPAAAAAARLSLPHGYLSSRALYAPAALICRGHPLASSLTLVEKLVGRAAGNTPLHQTDRHQRGQSIL